MLHNIVPSSAEAATGAERASKRTNDHIHLCRIHVLRLGQATAGTAKNTKGPCFVEDDAELVLFLELNLR